MRLEIDGQQIDVADSSTVLDAVQALGIRVPTLCHLLGAEHMTSCMVCLVKDETTGKMLPSCSMPGRDGMVLTAASTEVQDARKTALELLLSEHVGDCEAPCRRGCPADMDIPLMLRQTVAGDWSGALKTVKQHIPLPAILGRICPAPCEKVCRRRQADGAVGICGLKRLVADLDLALPAPYVPERQPGSGKRVAVIGAGPAGLSAGYYLGQDGHDVTVFEQAANAGGGLRTGVDRERLPLTVLDAEFATIASVGLELVFNQGIAATVDAESLLDKFDAVVLCPGEQGAQEVARAFGVRMGERGIQVTAGTYQTSRANIFAGGAAIGAAGQRLAVRAVGHGRELAVSVRQYLAGELMQGARKNFNCTMGRLQDGEIEAFVAGAEASGRVTPTGTDDGGFTKAEGMTEASRCLNCDCRKKDACRLRDFAGEYGANHHRYRTQRPRFEQIRQNSKVIYEPGKCIKCGRCVRITQRAGEELGLTYIGRGFEVRIGVPFNEPLARGLAKTAAECIVACPTGALATPVALHDAL